MKIPPAPQSGSTSVLGHTYSVNDDTHSSFQRGSGWTRSSGKLQQHDGVLVVLEKYVGRASPTRKLEEEVERGAPASN